MHVPWRYLVRIMLLLLAVVCGLGFRSSFEPGADPAQVMKVVYGVVGTGCLVAAGWGFFRC
jgi:hypothetical protein